MNRNEVDMTKITPMMKQYLDIKKQYLDTILFFRLGDFYEMFFEDANIAARELELTLTGKNAGLDTKIPMCGVPHHAASLYIEKLVAKGYKVGICEQVEDPKDAKGIVKRDVVQVVSSGTLINNESLNEKENNYIGAIIDFHHAYGLVYADISTGEVFAKLIDMNLSKIVSEVVYLNIKELIVNSNIDIALTNLLKDQFAVVISHYNNIEEYDEYKQLYSHIKDIRYIETIKYLLTYLNETQKRNLLHLQPVVIKDDNSYLKMDLHTKNNLELTETIRLKQRNYSLLWLLDKTKTAMGSRMLKTYIEYPLISTKLINRRLDMVEVLLKEFILKGDLQNCLYEVYDLERLSGRIAFGNANARDLLQLKLSLKDLPNIKTIVTKLNFDHEITTFEDLYILLEKSINENAPLTIKDGYLIKDGFNLELDELRSLRKGGKDFIAKFELEEKERTGIKNLKVGYNRVFGYYIEVSKGSVSLVKDEFGYERRQTLSNCERYISPILKEKESLILNAEENIVKLEYELFVDIRNQIKNYIPKIQTLAKSLGELDVMQAFATVSEENRYIRPIFNNKNEMTIIDSRHPVVEKVTNYEFVTNDIVMNDQTNILLITGPNMAGKSTYMRQTAILVIMAQIGCFVPAKSASMPIFDAIYTRIGASDDLVSGQSTFMVEMLEANNAINNATSNSLILFDELGRGTATFDGMALAQAIIEHIHDNIKCKTLFSTHYHELTDLNNNLINLKNIHVSAIEEAGEITFLHKVKDGSIDKSYGIHVAKLAHLPDSLIKRAEVILNIYENKEKKHDNKIQESINFVEETKHSVIEEELSNLNPLEITPLEALNILYNLKAKIKK